MKAVRWLSLKAVGDCGMLRVWPVCWLVGSLGGWMVCWLVGRLAGWLIGWLAGLLVGLSVGLLVGWSVGWLVGWFVCRLVGLQQMRRLAAGRASSVLAAGLLYGVGGGRWYLAGWLVGCLTSLWDGC